jgi:hypothetical protein
LLLNSLIGGFGMNFKKPITKLVKFEHYIDLAKTRSMVKNESFINDQVLITYYSDIDKSVCEKFNVDYVEALNEAEFDEIKYNRSSRPTSKIYLNKPQL